MNDLELKLIKMLLLGLMKGEITFTFYLIYIKT